MKHKIPDPDAIPKPPAGGRYIIECRMVIPPAYEHSDGPVCGQWAERARFKTAEERDRAFAGLSERKILNPKASRAEFRVRNE